MGATGPRGREGLKGPARSVEELQGGGGRPAGGGAVERACGGSSFFFPLAVRRSGRTEREDPVRPFFWQFRPFPSLVDVLVLFSTKL